MVMQSNGKNARMLADLHDHDYYPEWLPDGRYVAFFSGPDYESFDLYRVEVGTGKIDRLTEGLGAGKAAWMPDGKSIVFGRVSGEGSEIVVMDLAQSVQQRLMAI